MVAGVDGGPGVITSFPLFLQDAAFFLPIFQDILSSKISGPGQQQPITLSSSFPPIRTQGRRIQEGWAVD